MKRLLLIICFVCPVAFGQSDNWPYNLYDPDAQVDRFGSAIHLSVVLNKYIDGHDLEYGMFKLAEGIMLKDNARLEEADQLLYGTMWYALKPFLITAIRGAHILTRDQIIRGGQIKGLAVGFAAGIAAATTAILATQYYYSETTEPETPEPETPEPETTEPETTEYEYSWEDEL